MNAFLAYLISAIAFFADPCEAGERYFIASQPGTGAILYLREGETMMRVLMLGGHEVMGPIAVDSTSGKLFVQDNAFAKIFWYQLIQDPTGALIYDGRKHVALEGIISESMTCDGQGNLYVAGNKLTAVTPTAPAPPKAIIKISTMQLIMGVTVIAGPPFGVWSTANSGSPPLMFSPLAIQSDGSTIYWGNSVGGTKHGTVVKGGAGGGGLTKLVDQGEKCTAVGISGDSLFYSTENGIFGISLDKKEAGCGPPPSTQKKGMNPMKLSLQNGKQSGPCRLISNELTNTIGMFWDGDGTMYTADPNSGIYSFPSGNLEQHQVKKVVDASGLVDIEMLQIDTKSIASVGTTPSLVLLAALLFSKASS